MVTSQVQSSYGVRVEAKIGVQISIRELHTNIHLNYARVKLHSHIKKKKKKGNYLFFEHLQITKLNITYFKVRKSNNT